MAFSDRPTFSDEDVNNSSNYPESSPDPLALSYNENKLRTKAKRNRKQPLAPTSANTKPRESDITRHLDFSSPSKSMVMNTGRTSGASPWRIKVTVEAEPGSGASDEENVGYGSPTRKRMTRTTTTTVPLKDPDASSPVKRRGRPRKSDEPTSSKAKRSSTPARRKPRKSNVGVADSNVAETPVEDAKVPPKKRRGRPRKSIQPEDIIYDDIQTENDKVQEAEFEEIVVQPALGVIDTATVQYPALEPSNNTPSRGKDASTQPSSPLSTLGNLQSLKNAKKVQGRVSTPAKPRDMPTFTPSNSDDEDEPTYDDLVELSHHSIALVEDKASTAEVNEENDHFPEGCTMVDGTTILESENFSMISVESLPSRQGRSSPFVVPPSTKLSISKPTPQKSLLIPSSGRLDSASRSSLSLFGQQLQAEPAPSVLRSSPPQRQRTPAIDARSPSAPPPIDIPRSSPHKTSTPKLAKVVKAGIALQGVLDPTKRTPAGQSEEEALNEQKDRLDDLFRGFSDGTRRELRAGIRLGEQLARQSQSRQASKESSPAPLSASKPDPLIGFQNDPFNVPSPTQRTEVQSARLLTPEDQDDYDLAVPSQIQHAEVEYPTLNLRMQQRQLVSPARSDDEMSWRVDTPPVKVQHPSQSVRSAFDARVQRERDAVKQQFEDMEKSLVASIQGDEPEREDYSDIWVEEASRSSELPLDTQASRSPQLEDLFPDDGSLPKPARSKLPRTWRRKSSSDFHYSDEAEPEAGAKQQQEKLQSPESSSSSHKEKGRLEEPIIIEEDDEESEGSDDTGMFWQQNLPTVFNRSSRPERSRSTSAELKSDKLDLSMLLGEAESPVKDSSILHTPQKSSPFKNAPRFSAVQASPYKSSPLRQAYEPRDLESDQSYETSVLQSDYPQSSPFRTHVDDTETSDIRQLRQEMEHRGTDSSEVRQLGEEVQAYAYEPRTHTLHDIEEVTERSRSELTERSRVKPPSITLALPSSPPQVPTSDALAPKRVYSPLFGNALIQQAEMTAKPVSRPQIEITPPLEDAQSSSSGFFGRITSSIWGSLAGPTSPPPHPTASKYDPLPRVEPWTKTHYKTLDALFQQYKRKASLFAPSNPPNTNNALLRSFPRKYVGAKFSSWGYSVVMTESYVVIAAVFMQLLQLKDIKEYERISGKQIQMGDCAPGKTGTEIDAYCVMTRLATVIMGEDVRRDERLGIEIRRVGGMSIAWP